MGRILITGASSGIGEEFANQFAASGKNLLLVARREDRLLALCAELKKKYKIDADYVVCDLSKKTGPGELVKKINANGWKIFGLINNAGFGEIGRFAALPLDRQMDMIQLNVASLVELSHRLIPMLKTQNDAFIINVASTSAFQAGPGMAVYFATKAFVLSFSEALHNELKKEGIAVSTLCPGATETEFSGIASMEKSKMFKYTTMPSKDVVEIAIRNRKKAIVVAGLRNVILMTAGKFSPRAITRAISGWLIT
ncbi:MAG: SDR family oxidoreductase [Rhodospirillaceae bacterium]|nr:SDR family oxidoreductase [Rhodospirillaceae bacterium]